MPIYINNVFNILSLINPQPDNSEYQKSSLMFLDFLLSLYGFKHIKLWENSIDNQIINSIFFSQPNKFVPNTLTSGFIMVYQKNDKPKYVTLTNDCYQTKGINTNAGQSFSNKNNLKFRLVPSDPDDATKPWTNSYIDFNSIEENDFQDKQSFINFIIKKSNYAFDISDIESVFLIYNPKLNTQLNFINLYKNNKLFSKENLNKIQTIHDNQELQTLQEKQKQQVSPSVGGKHKKIKNKKSKKKIKKNNEEIIDIKKFFSPKAKHKLKNNKQNKSKKIKIKPTTQKKSGGGKNMQIVKPQVTITDAIKSLLLNKNLQGNKWLLSIPEINKLLKKKPNKKPVTRCAAAETANIEAANPDVSNPEPIATCRAATSADILASQ